MNVLITPNFSNVMKASSKTAQNEVLDIFSRISKMTREELEGSAFLRAVTDTSSPIYVYVGSFVQVFLTFDGKGNVLFLNIVPSSGVADYTESVGGVEVALYDYGGTPVAYVSTDDDRTIYAFNGQPLAYLDGEKVYGFNGKHLGWFEDGVLIDTDGRPVGFVLEKLQVAARLQPLKSFKRFKPFKSFKQFSRFKPFRKSMPSSLDLGEFLEAGAK